MKKSIIILAVFLLCASSCTLLDSKDDLQLTDEMLQTRYYHLFNMGYRTYNCVPDGFSRIDNNLFATVSDEAQYVTTLSKSARFNDGSWSQYNNPDDCYDWFYVGIHDVNYFLENTVDYVEALAQSRDTITTSGRYSYEQDVLNMSRLREEAVVLRAYYYFELIKRYGGVPVIKSIADKDYSERATYDSVVKMIVDDIDSVMDKLVDSWVEETLSNYDGRLTKGAARAIKSRVLLYAASPLNNPSNDTEKWMAAAKAAYDVINMGRYSLTDSYQDLFYSAATNTNPEVIWAKRNSASNTIEKANYPIGTQGGNTGVCPSLNLVKAYEHKGATNPSNWFENLDPRCAATIVKNLDYWNGREMQIYAGGTDSPSNPNSSPTGFYLKKFLNPDLNLVNDATEIHSWILFRYAEILLNYAEAMNEIYGPDGKGSFGLSAREAVNMIRSREGVEMPPVAATDKDSMRDAIKRERRVELAFEEHRFWDLLRWKDAETALNTTILGVDNIPDGSSYVWREKTVSTRKFDASKMYLYPIPQTEIVRTGNQITQNPNW